MEVTRWAQRHASRAYVTFNGTGASSVACVSELEDLWHLFWVVTVKI